MRKKHIILIIFIAAAGVGLFLRTKIVAHVEDVLSTDTVKAEPAAEPVPKFDIAALSAELDPIVAAYPGLDIGIAINDLSSEQQLIYGETAPYEAASITKLLTTATLMNAIEEGELSLSSTIGGRSVSSLLKAMIEVSDNDAWVAIDLNLGYPAIRAYAASIGLTSYSSKTNTLSTADASLLLQKLYTGQLFNKANTDLILGHMAKANNKYIGTSLDSSYTVYHKSGYLDDRLMDSAVITGKGRTYVLVIFSKALSGTYDFVAGKALFNSITDTVHASLTAKPD